jgi:CBS domain-containing protein
MAGARLPAARAQRAAGTNAATGEHCAGALRRSHTPDPRQEPAMLKLRDFMTRDVATLAPEDTLRAAIAMLSERFITGAPVVSGDDVVGVVSAMDIMDFAATAMALPAETQAEEWPADDAGDDVASSYFTDLWDRGTDLLDDGGVLAHDVLEDHTVGDAMTTTLLMLPGDAEVHEAAAYMIEHGVHRVLVADAGQLEGLVTTTDFLRLIAERRL